MRERAWDWAWIAVIGGILFFTNLGGPGLWDEDEPIYAACAREMIQRNDWVVPRYNGEMFPDKPPLMFWMMMAGFGLFGYSELGARFLSPIAAVMAAWATYELGRRLFSRRTAFWGAVMAMSNLLYVVSARAATVDAALTLLTVGTMLAFVVGYGPILGLGKHHTGGTGEKETESPARPVMWAVWAMWGCMALAILAKGPIGLLLPAAAIGLFLMIVGRANRDQPARGPWMWRAMVTTARVWDPRNFAKAFVQMQPWWAFPAVALFALPWFVWVGWRTDGAWLREFFAMYNLRPFTQPIQGHQGPVWYHVASLLGGFFPWSVFIGLVFHDAVRRIARRDEARDGLIFCFTWLGIWFVFWSICSTKLPHYLLPAFPAVGLLTAAFFERWCEGTLPVRRWEVNTAMGIAMAVGVGIMIAVPLAAAKVGLPGLGWTGGLGIILVAGGIAGILLGPNRPRKLRLVYAVTSVAALTAVFAGAAQVVADHQNAAPMLAEIRARCRATPALIGFRYLQESVVFYAGEPVRYLDRYDALAEALDAETSEVVMTYEDQLPGLRKEFGDRLIELTRYNNFMKSKEVVVLIDREDVSRFAPPQNRELETASARRPTVAPDFASVTADANDGVPESAKPVRDSTESDKES